MNVLWLEDEQEAMRYEKRLARNDGWRITQATHAEEAYGHLTRRRFDLLVLDLILPRDEYERRRGVVEPKTGIELLERVEVSLARAGPGKM
jgi:CheY-like chemotaxis protein